MEDLIYYSSLPGRLQYCLYINNACNFLLSTENIYIIYICIITITIHNLETGVLLIYTNRSYLTYFFLFPRCSASLRTCCCTPVFLWFSLIGLVVTPRFLLPTSLPAVFFSCVSDAYIKEPM